MKKFTKRFLFFMIGVCCLIVLAYIVAFSIGEPDLNKDRYLKLYDDQDNIFYQSINHYSGQYVSLNDVSHYFKRQLSLLKIKDFMNIMVLIILVLLVL